MANRAAVLVAALSYLALPAPADSVRSGACEALAALRLPQVTIVRTDAIEAGKFAAPDGESYDVPVFCRVHGEARPTGDSRIGFEVWMPASGWNGRYYQLGNGGFAGNIHYPSLAADVRRGNAVAVTDTGHRGGGFDASWARGHPQKIIDYGYRSLKETSDAARALIHAYYGAQPRHSYFAGCSNGGRQALMLAQRYPDDWDGILAGAPANHWTRQLASFAWLQNALRSDQQSWIAPAKLPAIQRAAIASCTADAGVANGVPTDPRFCRFDPSDLLCRSEETNDCLTRKQAAALAAIQDGPRDPDTRARLHFGFEPTAAAVVDNWERWIVNTDRSADTQLTLGEQFYRNIVFGAASWQIEDFNPQRDFALAQNATAAGESLAGVLDATDADLTRFERSGAKLLMYFGWADALISPRAGVSYYERVGERMGIEKTRAFFRLFMVPGMTHCQGGPGANAFGQAPVSPGLHDDAAHDIRRALEAWVERRAAPDSIVAAKYLNDDPAQGVAMTRPLCAFPKVSEYRGAGAPVRAAEFRCVDAPAR